MIYGLTEAEREARAEAKKEHRRRWLLRFAYLPVKLADGRYLWLEWYRVRRFFWASNERHATTPADFKRIWS